MVANTCLSTHQRGKRNRSPSPVSPRFILTKTAFPGYMSRFFLPYRQAKKNSSIIKHNQQNNVDFPHSKEAATTSQQVPRKDLLHESNYRPGRRHNL